MLYRLVRWLAIAGAGSPAGAKLYALVGPNGTPLWTGTTLNDNLRRPCGQQVAR